MSVAAAASNAVKAASDAVSTSLPSLSKTGESIFVWTHLRTKQTIYSLRKSMHNASALSQLTFVGKKSVPASLRKDLWSPLCVVSFPSAAQGLDAYNKLRQFRILHETQWDPKEISKLPKKQKTRRLQDQRANSVADMAHVLLMQERPPTEREVAKARWFNTLPTRTTSRGRVRVPDRPKFGQGSKQTLGAIEWRGSVQGVRIHWTNILDAEFAETWPVDVLHGRLETTRHGMVWPPVDEASRSMEEQREVDLARLQGAKEEAAAPAA